MREAFDIRYEALMAIAMSDIKPDDE